jgi:hypothetical protein
MNFPIRAHTLLLCVGGSRAYGLHTERSDVDVKGVAVPPAPVLFGFLHRFEQAEGPAAVDPFADTLNEEERAAVAREKLEGVIYELRKFMSLAADNNPNILDVLFCRDAEVRHITPVGERLREAAPRFLSMAARHTFSGYALSQLKRIETHRRWLIDPPTVEPARADFGLPPRTLIPSDQLAAAQDAIRKKVDSWELDFGEMPDASKLYVREQIENMLVERHIYSESRFAAAARSIGYEENFIDLLDRERHYKAARNNWDQFHTWQRSRNPARAALEAQHGYDTKHAMHLLRLLRMGREILETGTVHVWRGDRDRDELLAVRAGALPYDQLIEQARADEARLTALYAAKNSPLPRVADREGLNTLCIELIEAALASA